MDAFIESYRQNREFLVRLEEHRQKTVKEEVARDHQFSSNWQHSLPDEGCSIILNSLFLHLLEKYENGVIHINLAGKIH